MNIFIGLNLKKNNYSKIKHVLIILIYFSLTKINKKIFIKINKFFNPLINNVKQIFLNHSDTYVFSPK